MVQVMGSFSYGEGSPDSEKWTGLLYIWMYLCANWSSGRLLHSPLLQCNTWVALASEAAINLNFKVDIHFHSALFLLHMLHVNGSLKKYNSLQCRSPGYLFTTRHGRLGCIKCSMSQSITLLGACCPNLIRLSFWVSQFPEGYYNMYNHLVPWIQGCLLPIRLEGRLHLK